MPGIAGVSYLEAVEALQRAGFSIFSQRKHIALTNGERIVTVPVADPIHPLTMLGIVLDAGLTEDEFRALLAG